YSPAYCWRAILLFTVGTCEEAVAELQRGLEYDPVSAYLEAHLGIILCFGGQWERACEHCSKALDLDPNFLVARCALALAYQFQSHTERAIRELEKAVEVSGRDPWALSYLAAVYAASGEHHEAQHLLIELEQRRNREYITAINFAGIYFQLRKLDQGFECLDAACQERAPQSSLIHQNPLIATAEVRNDARFARVMDRIGLKHDRWASCRPDLR